MARHDQLAIATRGEALTPPGSGEGDDITEPTNAALLIEGRDARVGGISQIENPYPRDSEAWVVWNIGWLEAGAAAELNPQNDE
jgi:hypothetical protein